jgi:hypothetical protein
MLVLIALGEGYVARKSLTFSTVVVENWRSSGFAAARMKRTRLVCLGSSLVKCGVLPRMLTRHTGLQAYNLGLFNGNIVTSYYLLRRMVESGTIPEAVAVDCVNGPVARKLPPGPPAFLGANLRQWPALIGLRDTLDLAWSTRDASFLAAIVTAKLLPSYQSRFEIRDSIETALRGDWYRSLGRILISQQNWATNRGGHGMVSTLPTDPPPAPPANTLAAIPYSPRDWKREKVSESYIRRFLDLAAAHDIKVFWLLPPNGPMPLAVRTQSGEHDYATRLAQSVLKRYRNVYVIDGRVGYRPEVFPDGVHLDVQGALSFSDDVGMVIARYLAAPKTTSRWVTLPPFHKVHPDVPVEDYNQSMLALRSTAGKTRR